ncbi:putative RNA recognition motif domain, nucleotide-binding alpha-beta plait domain superfamily [Helianthus annuus]|nr:putative RNA recognition motif domain, nucleotide-binding alpha-beta plait domain superfamily [Helianthus annuus]
MASDAAVSCNDVPTTPPHYMPYYQQQYQQQLQHTQQKGGHLQPTSEDNKTVWVGDLQHWMDETYLQSCFAQTGEVASIKLIRNKQTGQSERYGFIEFHTHEAAEKVLQTYNGSMMPNTDQVFRLNWASLVRVKNVQTLVQIYLYL